MRTLRWVPSDFKRIADPLFTLAIALSAGLLVCSVLALLLGVNPSHLLRGLWEGAWGSKDAAAASLVKVTPLLLTGLAVSVAYQVGLLNIGCEGQLTLGALAVASFAVVVPPLPPLLLLPLTLLVGASVGALWALLPIWLRQRRGVHEVISTLLLNYVAIYMAEYLVLHHLGDGTAMGRTVEIPGEATCSPLWQLGAVGLTPAPFLALLLSFATQIWLSATTWGYEIRATGDNPLASRAAGIAVHGWQLRCFLLSGALAGLAGALEIVSVHHRFYRAFSSGYGFDGITAAFLVGAAPGWLWPSALMLAGLRAADKWVQLTLGISPNIILVIQATLLLVVASQFRLKTLLLDFLSKRVWRRKEMQG